MVSTMILFLVMILMISKIVLLKVRVCTNEAIVMAITMMLNDAMVKRNLKRLKAPMETVARCEDPKISEERLDRAGSPKMQ